MFSPDRRSTTLVTLIATAGFVLLQLPAHAQSAREIQTFQSFLEIVDSYLAIIESSHAVYSDDGKTAVAQLTKIKEIFDESDDVDGAVKFFEDILARTEHRTVRNTAYTLLIDVLKDAGRFDEAETAARNALKDTIDALDAEN